MDRKTIVPMGRRATVSERALIQRINRKLDGRVLKVTRGRQLKQAFGSRYILDIHHNRLIEGRVNVETLGREMGCLEDWETVTRKWCFDDSRRLKSGVVE